MDVVEERAGCKWGCGWMSSGGKEEKEGLGESASGVAENLSLSEFDDVLGVARGFRESERGPEYQLSMMDELRFNVDFMLLNEDDGFAVDGPDILRLTIPLEGNPAVEGEGGKGG